METKHDSLGEFRDKLSKMLMFKRRSRAAGVGFPELRFNQEGDGDSSPVQRYWSARRSLSPDNRDEEPAPEPPVTFHSIPLPGSTFDRLAHVSPRVRVAKAPLIEPSSALESVPFETSTPVVNEIESTKRDAVDMGPSIMSQMRKLDSERLEPRHIQVKTTRRKHSPMKLASSDSTEAQKPGPKIIPVEVKKPLEPVEEAKEPIPEDADHLVAIRGLLRHARTTESLVSVRKNKSSAFSLRGSLTEDANPKPELQPTEYPIRRDPVVPKDMVITQSYQHIPTGSKPVPKPPVTKVRRSASSSASDVNSELSQWIANARKDLETILSN